MASSVAGLIPMLVPLFPGCKQFFADRGGSWRWTTNQRQNRGKEAGLPLHPGLSDLTSRSSPIVGLTLRGCESFDVCPGYVPSLMGVTPNVPTMSDVYRTPVRRTGDERFTTSPGEGCGHTHSQAEP